MESTETLEKKTDLVLIALLDKLEKEAAKEPMDTLNVSALSEAIRVLKTP